MLLLRGQCEGRGAAHLCHVSHQALPHSLPAPRPWPEATVVQAAHAGELLETLLHPMTCAHRNGFEAGMAGFRLPGIGVIVDEKAVLNGV